MGSRFSFSISSSVSISTNFLFTVAAVNLCWYYKSDLSLDSLSRNSLCLGIWLRFLVLKCYVIRILFGCEMLFFIGS